MTYHRSSKARKTS